MNVQVQRYEFERYQILLKYLQFGCAISILTQPFDVLRTSMIVSQPKTANINLSGMVELILQIRRKEGWKGFYRATHMAIVKNSISAVLFFSGIDNFSKFNKTYFKHLESNYIFQTIINICGACISKFFSIAIVNPLIVVKTKLEVVGCHKYNGAVDCFRKTNFFEGIRGFYRGLFPTLLRDIPYSGLQYSCYQNLLKISSLFVKNPRDESKVVLFCATTSSTFVILLTYPFDNIRVRWQAGETKGFPLRKIIPYVYKIEGLKGFYKGYLPRIMKKSFSSGIFWSLYEKINNRSSPE